MFLVSLSSEARGPELTNVSSKEASLAIQDNTVSIPHPVARTIVKSHSLEWNEILPLLWLPPRIKALPKVMTQSAVILSPCCSSWTPGESMLLHLFLPTELDRPFWLDFTHLHTWHGFQNYPDVSHCQTLTFKVPSLIPHTESKVPQEAPNPAGSRALPPPRHSSLALFLGTPPRHSSPFP